jgi:putative oxidoreductase
LKRGRLKSRPLLPTNESFFPVGLHTNGVKSNPNFEGYQIESVDAHATGSNQLEVAMIDIRTAPYAAFLLRVTLGALFLAHAGLKLFILTPAGTAQFFGKIGLEPSLAYVVIAAEVLGGIALIVGLWTRVVAIALTPILLGAIFTVHGAAGFFFNNANGGWEYPAFWTAMLIVQALLGDGALALKPTPAVANHPVLVR